MSDDKGKKTIKFNANKKETHHPGNGFKKLSRRLKQNYQILTNKDEISGDNLADADLLVLGGPRDLFSTDEFEDLKKWISNGGRALFLVGDGGDRVGSGCNINYLLEEYGISVNPDSVMRNVFYKYLHPKEVHIADGVIVPDIVRKKNKVSMGKKNVQKDGEEKGANKLPFVFPYGASLNVERPAIPLLSSGAISYPRNRPISALWEAETVTSEGKNVRGKFVVVGSVEIFGDDWLDKEENSKLCDVLFSWLLDDISIDVTTERQEAELADYTTIPNIELLSQNLKPCLEGSDDLPRDFTKLFDLDMFRFDTNLIPLTIKCYDTLGVQHDTLSLIQPQFECPLPKLTPATFPPAIREPPPPALDQFDLDEQFAKEGLRLAQLTNKCTSGEEDLEYYIYESADILGIMPDLPHGSGSAKHILFHIFKQVVDFKRADSTGIVGYGSDNMFGDASRESKTQDSPVQTVQAKPIVHVDLAPMKQKGNLKELNPNMQIGGVGSALGGISYK